MKAWRSVGQAISFALFGLGGWVLAAALYPLAWLIPMRQDVRTARIQKVIHYFFRFFLGFVETLGVMEFRLEGDAVLRGDGGGIVIANHPCLLDVVLLISRMPQADCIVKKELWTNIFLRHVIASAGYLPNDDGPGLMAAAIERVKQGRKVIIFPEGTRSLPGMMHPYSNGFAHIAVRADCPVWPVILTCHPPSLRKGGGFFEVPATRPRLTGVVQPPLIPTACFDREDPVPVAVRKMAVAARRYFEEKLGYGGSQSA